MRWGGAWLLWKSDGMLSASDHDLSQNSREVWCRAARLTARPGLGERVGAAKGTGLGGGSCRGGERSGGGGRDFSRSGISGWSIRPGARKTGNFAERRLYVDLVAFPRGDFQDRPKPAGRRWPRRGDPAPDSRTEAYLSSSAKSVTYSPGTAMGRTPSSSAAQPKPEPVRVVRAGQLRTFPSRTGG